MATDTRDSLGDLKDLVDLIDVRLREALDAEEKRLLGEKALLQEIYEQVTGSSFEQKAATDLTVIWVASLLKDLAPDLYANVEAEADGVSL